MALFFTLALAVPLGAQVAALPAHDYVFVATSDVGTPSALLATLRDQLIVTIAESGLAPGGYPRPCSMLSERPGGLRLSCRESPAEPAPRTGVLLDPEGHYLELSVVDFPDTRVYLAEVLFVRELPDRRLAGKERYTLPRVVLHLPYISSAWHPRTWTLIGQALERAGTRVLPRADSE